MKHYFLKTASILIILLNLVLCTGFFGSSKLNTDNEQKFTDSLTKMYKELPENEQESFRLFVNIALNGIENHFNADYRDFRTIIVPKNLENFISLYSRAFKHGNEQYIAKFKSLNGLSAAELMDIGKAKYLTNLNTHLNFIQDKIQKLNEQIESIKIFEQELTNIKVILGDNIEVEGFTGTLLKSGYEGSLAVDIEIVNNSSYKLLGFLGTSVTFIDTSGNEIIPSNAEKLNKFALEDGTMPFQDHGKGLEPGQTVKGTLVSRFARVKKSTTIPTFKAKFYNDKIEYDLECDKFFKSYNLNSINKDVDESSKTQSSIKAELSKFNQ
jgi:hypothetical protein